MKIYITFLNCEMLLILNREIALEIIFRIRLSLVTEYHARALLQFLPPPPK